MNHKLPTEEPEPYLPWYKGSYTLREYCLLCEQAYRQSESLHYVTASLYHEMKYAMQHIRSSSVDLLDGSD